MTPTSYIKDNLKITRNFYNFGNEFLAKLIDWIGYAFEPDDIYNQEQLKEWFQKNFDFTETTTDEEIIKYVKGSFSPSQVFSEEELEGWANKHGYRYVE